MKRFLIEIAGTPLQCLSLANLESQFEASQYGMMGFKCYFTIPRAMHLAAVEILITLPQKKSGKKSPVKKWRKSDRSIRKVDQKVTERAPKTKQSERTPFLGPDSGRTDFSRIFIFEPPDFFADLVAGFFLLIFVGKSAQKNPPGKIPGKILQNLYNKNPRHISAEGPGQPFADLFLAPWSNTVRSAAISDCDIHPFGRHRAGHSKVWPTKLWPECSWEIPQILSLDGRNRAIVLAEKGKIW